MAISKSLLSCVPVFDIRVNLKRFQALLRLSIVTLILTDRNSILV